MTMKKIFGIKNWLRSMMGENMLAYPLWWQVVLLCLAGVYLTAGVLLLLGIFNV